MVVSRVRFEIDNRRKECKRLLARSTKNETVVKSITCQPTNWVCEFFSVLVYWDDLRVSWDDGAIFGFHRINKK